MSVRRLLPLLIFPLAAACGDDASTGASGAKSGDGAVPNAGIQPSPGTKGPGKVDSSGGGEAGQGPGGSGSTNLDYDSKKSR